MSATITLNGKATIELTVKDYESPIIIEVDGDNAPITAGNYVDLVDHDIYDGLAFHRVEKEPEPFVVQGGDPQGKDPDFPIEDMGGGGFIDPITGERRNIPLEIKPEGADEPVYSETLAEGVEPELKHTRGAVAMARSLLPDSASSQFYFALRDLEFLDGNYAVFGYVLEGMDVVDQIVVGDRIETAEITTIDSMLYTGDNNSEFLSGTSFNDEMNGRGGDDTILGNNGNDTINGGIDNDVLSGGDGKDNITGGDGDDTLDGGLGEDNMRGSDGDDLYLVDSETDSTRKEKADGGVDTVQASLSWTLGKNIENLFFDVKGNFSGTGNNLNNEISGNEQQNRLVGRDGDDLLFGREGSDRLFAGEGNDILVGGAGDDELTGDPGNDIFAFNSPTDGTDTIIDFNVENDSIGILASGFEGGLTQGVLLEEQFHLGTTAQTEQHRFIYNSDSGSLFYDADGNGETAPVEIAILQGSPSLSFNNIFVTS